MPGGEHHSISSTATDSFRDLPIVEDERTSGGSSRQALAIATHQAEAVGGIATKGLRKFSDRTGVTHG